MACLGSELSLLEVATFGDPAPGDAKVCDCGTGGKTYTEAVAVDSKSGDVYISGSTSADWLERNRNTKEGIQDGFLAKYNTNGTR
jgi:hypothetical protein